MATPAASVIKTGNTLTIFFCGKVYTIDQTVKNYEEILSLVKARNWDDLQAQLDIATLVAKKSNGRAEVVGDAVYLDGLELRGVLTERILGMLQEGWDVEPMLRFLENVAKNPAKWSIEELYLFLETNNLPITEDGCFLAYKVVREDYKDCHTGRVSNHIGAKPGQDPGTEMTREQVDPNRNNTCSKGYHFCSLGYIGHFAGGSNRLMIVKVNPADVVSIPSDYQNTKGRCWTYEVVDEIKMGTQEEYNRTAPSVVDTYKAPEVSDLSEKSDPAKMEEIVTGMINELLGYHTGKAHEATQRLSDVGMDELDCVELLMMLEEKFDVSIEAEPEDLLFMTVPEFCKTLCEAADEFDSQDDGSDYDGEEFEGADESEDLYELFNLTKGDQITGQDLKQIRDDNGVTGVALAEKLGVSRSCIWSYDNTVAPKEETVERILQAIYDLI